MGLYGLRSKHDIVLPGVESKMGDLLVVLITVALLFVIVSEHVQSVLVRILTGDPTGQFVFRVRDLFNNVLNRVFALVLKAMLHSEALDLLRTELPVRLLTIGFLLLRLCRWVCLLLLRLSLCISLGLLNPRLVMRLGRFGLVGLGDLVRLLLEIKDELAIWTMHRSIVVVAMIVADRVAAGVHKRRVEPVVVVVVNVFDGRRLRHGHLSDRLVVVYDYGLHLNGSRGLGLRLLGFRLFRFDLL